MLTAKVHVSDSALSTSPVAKEMKNASEKQNMV